MVTIRLGGVGKSTVRHRKPRESFDYGLRVQLEEWNHHWLVGFQIHFPGAGYEPAAQFMTSRLSFATLSCNICINHLLKLTARQIGSCVAPKTVDDNSPLPEDVAYVIGRYANADDLAAIGRHSLQVRS